MLHRVLPVLCSLTFCSVFLLGQNTTFFFLLPAFLYLSHLSTDWSCAPGPYETFLMILEAKECHHLWNRPQTSYLLVISKKSTCLSRAMVCSASQPASWGDHVLLLSICPVHQHSSSTVLEHSSLPRPKMVLLKTLLPYKS